MILTEQVIKRLSRTYWKGSQYENWDREKSPYKIFYVTTNPVYAATYSKEKDESAECCKYVTSFCLKNGLDIFNARHKKDIIRIENFCRTHKDFQQFLKYFYLLSDNNWLQVFGEENKNIFTDVLKNTEYDGFFNIEYYRGNISRVKIYPYKSEKSDAICGFSGIGIFDNSKLIQNEQFYGWEQIKNIPAIKEEIGWQIQALKNTIYKNQLYKNPKIVDFKKLQQSFDFLTIEDIENTFKNFNYLKEKQIRIKTVKRNEYYVRAKLYDWWMVPMEEITQENIDSFLRGFGRWTRKDI